MSVAERPILFSGPMVRAILAGTKTQTRRVVNLPRNMEPLNEDGEFEINDSFDERGKRVDWPYAASKKTGCTTAIECPYGVPGDVLWVREQFSYRDVDSNPSDLGVWYWADGPVPFGKWTRPKPSIHMPRWASRLSLLVKRVRVERLQNISIEDVLSEGPFGNSDGGSVVFGLSGMSYHFDIESRLARAKFAAVWDTISARRGFPWSSNPWVFVVEFERRA